MTGFIRCIAIFGGPGSGKRTVANSLAKRLQWAFVDFDVALEELAGQPMPHLLESAGQESADRLTTQVLADLIAPRPSVVAFDGRWPGNLLALERLRPAVLAVWLSASPQEAVRRMRADDRHHRMLEHSRPAEAVAAVLQGRTSIRSQTDFYPCRRCTWDVS